MNRDYRDLLLNLFVKCTYITNRRADADWTIDDVCSDYCNLLFIYDGKGTFIKNGKSMAVKKGDLVYFEKNCTRLMRTDPTDCLKLYTVNFTYVLPELKGGKWSISSPALEFDFIKNVSDERMFNRFSVLFERLVNVSLMRGSADEVQLREIMCKIFELVWYLYSAGTVNYAAKNTVDAAIKYMHAHINEKITLGDLSAAVKASPSYLNAMFKGITGTPPIDFLIKLRIEKAKQCLAGGTSVSQTAQICGFYDVYYFSSMFKKTEKITPTQYISASKAMRGENGYI